MTGEAPSCGTPLAARADLAPIYTRSAAGALPLLFIGAINAGIVSAGINAFYTQLAFGFVIVVSVVLQTIIDRRVRRQSMAGF